MIKKILKGLVIFLITAVILIPAVMLVSAKLSLNGDYQHTKATAALPRLENQLNQTTGDQLVRIAANGYEFRARIRGRAEAAETVILLHGFPVTSAMWMSLMDPLADAGYRVVAFDQRGYSPGARPEEVSAYAINNLVSDVLAVADVVGAERFHLIGHDWGSAVGWATVLGHPQRVQSWTGLSIAHPAAFLEAVNNDPDQQARSRYFALFVTPLLPETLMTFGGLAGLEAAYGNMLPAKIEEYLAVFVEPGALTAALNWYRASFSAGRETSSEVSQNVDTPTLFIWGENDPAAGRAAVDAQAKYMKGPYQRLDVDGDHWLMTSNTQEIIQAVIDHLGKHGS